MQVINLWGGPGSGKSTSAALLFAFLKNHGIRCELVGEEAKDQIYWGSKDQLGNQFLIAGLQYARLKNLERSGCTIAVADSPLLMNPYYAREMHYYRELMQIITKLNAEFHNVHVWIKRTKPYDTFGRTQKTIEEAKLIDDSLAARFAFDAHVTGDILGQQELCDWVYKLLLEQHQAKAVHA